MFFPEINILVIEELFFIFVLKELTSLGEFQFKHSVVLNKWKRKDLLDRGRRVALVFRRTRLASQFVFFGARK
jgi:hypothetical protein